MQRLFITVMVLFTASFAFAQGSFESQIDASVKAIEKKMIDWRRHLHANPELSNREFKTMDFIVQELSVLGLPIEKGAAKTGVIALLDTGKPGPVVGLRADIDALPVKERVKIDFASKVETEYEGKTVGVMHACGHDAHTAILLATAHVITLNTKIYLPAKLCLYSNPLKKEPR